MSVDYNIKPTADVPPASAIENELPAYRAISRGAVFALIFGTLSIFSFASWEFLSLSVLAVVVGFLADRKIQRMPDVLTGRGLAQAGLGLGLMFGLTAVTISFVQGMVRENRAKTFAREFEPVLAKGNFDDLLWFSQHPTGRRDKTPEELVSGMKNAGPPQSFAMETEAWRNLSDKLAGKGAEVHFRGIEFHGDEGLRIYAGAVYDVHNPNATRDEDKEAMALVVMKADRADNGQYEWWIDNVKYPYKSHSYVMPTAPVDDGHGHAH